MKGKASYDMLTGCYRGVNLAHHGNDCESLTQSYVVLFYSVNQNCNAIEMKPKFHICAQLLAF